MAKVGRPKNMRPHEIKLQLPKHPLKYQAKRMYWALLEMEKKMAKDITTVKMTEYTSLLSAYVEVCERLKKEGITYGTKTKQRMDTRRVAENGESGATAGMGEDEQVSVGAGISAPNPLT